MTCTYRFKIVAVVAAPAAIAAIARNASASEIHVAKTETITIEAAWKSSFSDNRQSGWKCSRGDGR